MLGEWVRFLKLIIKLSPHEALYKFILRYWDESVTELKEIQNEQS